WRALDSPRCAFVVLAFGVLAGRAAAQAPTVDTSVPALPGGAGSLLGSLSGGGNSLLGPMPGAGGGSFGNVPGRAGTLGGRPGPFAPKGVPTAVTTPGAGPGPTELQMPITAPPPQPVTPTTTRFSGTLELLAVEDDGPPDGLTLDRAIDLTLD